MLIQEEVVSIPVPFDRQLPPAAVQMARNRSDNAGAKIPNPGSGVHWSDKSYKALNESVSVHVHISPTSVSPLTHSLTHLLAHALTHSLLEKEHAALTEKKNKKRKVDSSKVSREQHR